LFALAMIVFAINLLKQKSHLDFVALIASVLTTAIITAATLVLLLVLNPLCALLRNRKGSPAAETQCYSLTDVGLSRQSASSDTLLKWGGARSLRKTKRAIYVGVSAASYFILPRHSFATDDEYQSFWNNIQKLAPNNRSRGR
jgi:hypothetical protein